MRINRGSALLTAIIISALSGGLVVGGTMYAIDKRGESSNKQTTELVTAIGSIKSEIAEAQLITTKNLTDLDLLKEPCSKEYIKEYSNLQCREMFCRVQTRGLDAAASQSECEEISNIQNSLIILDACNDREIVAYQACINIFSKRK